MPTQECPVCQATPVFAGRTPYCPRCGWQRQQVESQLRMNLKIAPILFAVLVVLVVVIWARSSGQGQGRMVALFMAFPAVLFAVNYWRARQNLKKLLEKPLPADFPEKMPGAAPRSAESQSPTEYLAVMKTSAPREVSMSARGKMNAIMPVVVVVIFEAVIGKHLYFIWASAHSFALFANKDWIALGLALLLLLIPLAIWRSQDKERDLLTNGEIAMAKVVKQWRDRSNSAIVYEFTDREGHEHRSSSIDYSGKLCEGRSVPVFYDRANPKRQVAYCGTSHKIVTFSGAPSANQ
jgi:hypothetical protein